MRLVFLIIFIYSLDVFAIGGKGPMEIAKTGLQNRKNPVLDKVGIDEHLGESIDLNLPFTDQYGNEVTLNKYFGEKPIFMVLIYYECPTLCSLHLNALVETLKEFEWQVGNEFDFVAISIDPQESSKLAQMKLDSYLELYGKPDQPEGWHFLTGSEESIKSITEQIGFRYAWDPREQQWVHGAAAYVLTPEGKISYYHYGMQINQKVLRLSLVEAADHKIGTILDRAVLFCMQYDPNKKTYSFYAFNIMRLGGVLTILIIGIYLFRFWRKESKKSD